MDAIKAGPAECGPEMGGLLPISASTLSPCAALDFDIFLHSSSEGTVLFRSRDYPLEETDFRRLRDTASAKLYVRVADHERYCEYLKQVVLDNPDLPASRRLQVLTAVNRSVFEAAFASPSVQRYVEFAREFAAELTDVICRDDVALTDIVRLMSHDYYTYTHVANVTIYCLCLARGLGIVDPQILRDITVGGLLHDYGKRYIPTSVLNNTGRLTEEEWFLIQQHPATGFRDLCPRADISWGQLMMVYQHHERMDGKGYPVGVGGDELHEWARLCKVADVFDALTADRPYRRGDRPGKVVEFMRSRGGSEFDEEMVRCFAAMIHSKD